jgi:hypothetical protein
MVRRSFIRLAAITCVALLGSATALRADVIGFAVDTLQNLYSVNFTTATATTIGNTGHFLEGLAISPGGQLFGTDTSGNLFSINSSTAAATLIGNTGRGNIEGLAFNGNTLLGTNFSNPTTIFSINTSNASTTDVVTTGQGVTRAMTIESANTALLSSDSPLSQSLIAVDLTTGANTNRGHFNDGNLITAIGFGDGTLFGLDGAGNVLTINPANAQVTVVGNAGGHFYLDLTIPAVAAVPEPTSLVAFGILTACTACYYGWCRRKRPT